MCVSGYMCMCVCVCGGKGGSKKMKRKGGREM